jgi:hypothetical protein
MAKLTFGQSEVGYSPKEPERISKVKSGFAELIDQVNEVKASASNPDTVNKCNIAISEIKEALMWTLIAVNS